MKGNSVMSAELTGGLMTTDKLCTVSGSPDDFDTMIETTGNSDLAQIKRNRMFPSQSAENGNAVPWLLTVLCIWQLVLHLIASVSSGDMRLMLPHLVAWLQDLLLFGFVAGAGYAAGFFMPEKRNRVNLAVKIILTLTGMLLALYPQTLREYLSFPVNIFSSDGSSIRIVLFEYLGPRRLWPALATAFMAAVALRITVRRISWDIVGIVLLPVLTIGLSTLSRTPNPVINSLKESAFSLIDGRGREVPALHAPSGSTGKMPIKAEVSSLLASAGNLSADRIFIIVLEGITATEFENSFLGAKSRFLERVGGNYSYFKNYNTTNLDSYTSLIAMLTSKQVPYRCYSDVCLYEAVNQTENITAALRNLGYYSLFVSTCSYHPFVPVRASWDRVMIRRDLRQQEGWVTAGSSRMEEAVEDRAAISDIVETAAAHPKVVVMHELIYGHTTEWQAKTGVTTLEYYDRYLAELFDALKSRGLDKRSLFVVVSDHGDRSQPSKADNYRVPLLIAGDGVKKLTDSRFRSHLDLQGITAAYLTGSALPIAHEKLFTVGSTERWVYGELKANGDHIFIDDRTGRVLRSVGSAEPKQLQQQFQQYVNRFASQYGSDNSQSSQLR